MKTKILSLILATTIILSVIITAPITASAETEGIFNYSVENGEATITSCKSFASGAITIPDTLGGYPVTSIGEDAFSGCSGLTSIEIPDGVTSIGNDAFAYCTRLKSIEIPDSVTNIGVYAFDGCYNLKYNEYDNGLYLGGKNNKYLYLAEAKSNKITTCKINESTKLIGYYAFYMCSGLTSIKIPSSVTRIGDRAFSDCTGLTSIEIPSSVTSIGDFAFFKCSGLTSIEIPSSVTSIGDFAFCYCSGLTSIEIPSSVTFIGGCAFEGCTGLTRIEIPKSVKIIGDRAFYGCSGLTSIEIPDSVTSIGNYAFSGCSGLTSIEIPDGVTSIGKGAFSYCTGLKSIEIPDSVMSISSNAFNGSDNLQYNKYDNALYLGNKSNPYHALIRATNISIISCQINNNAKLIAAGAFQGCTGLTSIEIPSSVKSMGDEAFHYCTGLESVTIPDSVTSIGDYAFYDCSSLQDVYYYGTEMQRGQINIGNYNNPLMSANWHYNPNPQQLEFEKKCKILKSIYLKTAIQTKSGAKKTDSSYDLRLISLIDNLKDYKEVGFYITVEGYNDGEGDEPIRYSSDTVYTSFINGTQTVRATDFDANYFNISTLTLPSYCYLSNINIVPFVVFTDGTELKGNGTNTAVKNYIK